MPDREKYIEVLSKVAKTVKEFSEDTPIKIGLECVEDILELLKEQEEVVRCKDCKHYDRDENCRLGTCLENGVCSTPDWFCADGRKHDN